MQILAICRQSLVYAHLGVQLHSLDTEGPGCLERYKAKQGSWQQFCCSGSALSALRA